MSEMSVKDVEGPEEQVPHLMRPGGILSAFSVPGGIPSTYVHCFIIQTLWVHAITIPFTGTLEGTGVIGLNGSIK